MRRTVLLVSVLIVMNNICVSGHGSTFLVGGDISALPKIESLGGVYQHEGRKADCLRILSAQGANCFRIRLFVNPTGRRMVVQDIGFAIKLAQRVKASGAKLLLNLHYSDTWADPGHQHKPAAWQDMDFDTLKQTLRAYTAGVVTRFKQAQVLPDIIQVGNEITPGFLWPDGKLYHKDDSQPHWKEFTALLKAGIAGVHEALSTEDNTRIMIHIDAGGRRAQTKWFFDNLMEHDVNFDIIGLSYYPWWHGTLEDLRHNLEITARDYDKDIMVVETAYPHRSNISRGKGSWTEDRMAWPISPEGQRDFLEAVVRVVRNTPDNRGLGVIWWYPESIPVSGTHIWFNGAMAIFDNEGKVLPAAGAFSSKAMQGPPAEYELVWSDEFTTNDKPDPDNWGYEQGFSRNEELQWYQSDNAQCKNGLLIIEGRREKIRNSNYQANSNDWRRKRRHAEYTSSSLRTRGKHEWRYGRFEMRARIDTRAGLWPAFWTLGTARPWPHCGEIDIMEYYRGMLLANAAWGNTRRWQAVWDDAKIPIETFGDPQWSTRFHVWCMDWDKEAIKLYVDDQLLNTIELGKTANRDTEEANPFHEPHYMLVNLAIGGTNGGDPSDTDFPARYEIDYIRVYQKDVTLPADPPSGPRSGPRQ
jgi:arabinogalactan endo-1,4-beta-galactosidase/beta-glucanase (GH16 family)